MNPYVTSHNSYTRFVSIATYLDAMVVKIGHDDIVFAVDGNEVWPGELVTFNASRSEFVYQTSVCRIVDKYLR